MSSPQRSTSKLGVCFVLLLCAGAAAWVYSQKSGELPFSASSVKEVTASSERASSQSSSKSETVDAHTSQTGGVVAELEKVLSKAVQSVTTASVEKQEENSALQVSAPLNTGPRARELGPEEAVMARVEKALSEEVAPTPGGDVASGSITEVPVKPKEQRQDSVVTGAFVSDLARWMVANYVESRHEGTPGRSTITLMQANARYSTSDTLRSSERDALKGRESILNYVFTPGMLEVLYRLYSPVFLEELEKAAAEPRRGRQLDASQVADMFKVYAGFLCRAAESLNAASRLDLPVLLRDVHKAAASEASADEDFAKAYTAHAAAREDGRSEEMAELSKRMVQSARLASMFDAKEESARLSLARALKQRATGPTLSQNDLIFLGEWLGRRKASPQAMVAAADICRRMAEKLTARAEGIEAPALQIQLPEDTLPIQSMLAAPAPVLNEPEQPMLVKVAEPAPTASAPEAVQPVPAAVPTPVPAQ